MHCNFLSLVFVVDFGYIPSLAFLFQCTSHFGIVVTKDRVSANENLGSYFGGSFGLFVDHVSRNTFNSLSYAILNNNKRFIKTAAERYSI